MLINALNTITMILYSVGTLHSLQSSLFQQTRKRQSQVRKTFCERYRLSIDNGAMIRDRNFAITYRLFETYVVY